MHNYKLDDDPADPRDDGRTTSTTTSDTHTQQLTRQAHMMTTTTTKPDAMNTTYGRKQLLTKTCGNRWKRTLRRETPEALGIMQKEF